MSFAESHRARVLELLADDPHVSGHALCDMTTYEVDAIVIDAVEQALVEHRGQDDEGRGLPPRWAITALGGYGRGQMCLRSDVDIQLILPDDAPDPGPFMRAFIEALSRRQLRVGHGVRTISEAIVLAREEPSFATAALTSRHLAGDPSMTEAVRAPVYHYLAGAGLGALVERVLIDRKRRADRLGDTVFVLEPDLKQGIGGLRDAHVVGWLALVTGRPFDRTVMFAEDFLLKVRMALHAHASFKCDRLAFEYQDLVAATLGTAPNRATAAAEEEAGVEQATIELMRRVHVAMRAIARRAQRHLELASDRLRAPVRTPLAGQPRFVRVGDRLARADGAPPRSSQDVASAVAAMLATGLPLEASLEDGFEALSRHIRGTARDDAALNAVVLALLLDPSPAASTALHTLHRANVLSTIVPEFEPVIGRISRDLYHVYTVDEHILRAVDKLKAIARGEHAEDLALATELMARCAHPRALAVATLLHDIGKGYGPGHHARGAELAEVVAPRLGLDADETALVALLVNHQADMALVAIRRDLADPRPIRAIGRVVGDLATLEALYLLTVADWSSVGPEAFSSWHRTLLTTLFERVRQLIAEESVFLDPKGIAEDKRRALLESELGEVPQAPGAASDPIDDFCSALPTRYFQMTPAEAVIRHFGLWQRFVARREVVVDIVRDAALGNAEITVVCEDRPGLLARVAGGLADAKLDVLSAEIQTLPEGAVLDAFQVSDPHGRLGVARHAQAALDAIAAAILAPEVRAPTLPASPSLDAASALPPVAPRVAASNDVASAHTVFDVTASDRQGLLYLIAAFFHAAGVSVDLAFVVTEGRLARDSFYVTRDGDKLAPELVSELIDALVTRLM